MPRRGAGSRPARGSPPESGCAARSRPRRPRTTRAPGAGRRTTRAGRAASPRAPQASSTSARASDAGTYPRRSDSASWSSSAASADASSTSAASASGFQAMTAAEPTISSGSGETRPSGHAPPSSSPHETSGAWHRFSNLGGGVDEHVVEIPQRALGEQRERRHPLHPDRRTVRSGSARVRWTRTRRSAPHAPRTLPAPARCVCARSPRRRASVAPIRQKVDLLTGADDDRTPAGRPRTPPARSARRRTPPPAHPRDSTCNARVTARPPDGPPARVRCRRSLPETGGSPPERPEGTTRCILGQRPGGVIVRDQHRQRPGVLGLRAGLPQRSRQCGASRAADTPGSRVTDGCRAAAEGLDLRARPAELDRQVALPTRGGGVRPRV